MESKVRLYVAGGAFLTCALLAIFGNLVTAFVVAIAAVSIVGAWIGLNHFFPAEPPAPPSEIPVPPRRKVTPPPTVLGSRRPTPTEQKSFSEQQFAALKTALKTPSASNNPVAGAGNSKSNSSSKRLTEAELREQLCNRQDELGPLIARSRRRQQELERWVQENVGQATPEALNSLRDSQLIIDALQKRFDKTHALLEEAITENTVLEVLEMPLIVDEDAMCHLKTGKTFRPLRHHEWESTLERLFNKVSPNQKRSPTGSFRMPPTGES